MIKALKNLLGLAQRDDATAGELAPSLPAAEAELAAAREAQTAAEAAYRAQLLTADEPALRKLVEARTDASVRVDRASALVDALGERLAAAQEREAEADRVIAYEAARRQGEEAAEALRELYPSYASGIVELLKAVAEAEIAVRAANRDLPRGAAPLPGVEGRVRDLPSVSEEVLSEIEVERWVRAGQILPGSFDPGEVRATGGNRGVLRVRGLPMSDGHPVELRRFTAREFFPASFTGGAERLAHVISLPGLREGDPKLFEPVQRPFQSGFDPMHVLGRISELRAVAPRGEPARVAKTVLIPMNNMPVSQ